MAVYKHIKTRSPFYAQFASLESFVNLELKVWSGDVVSDKPTEVTYSLEKEVSGGSATFEIAELIRDFISHNTQVDSGHVWAEVKMSDGVNPDDIEIYLASEGYGLYIEGVQSNNSTLPTDFIALPLENGTARMLEGGLYSQFQILVQPADDTNWFYRLINKSGIVQPTVNPITTTANVTSTSVVKTFGTLANSIGGYEFNFNGNIQTVLFDYEDCNRYEGAVLTYVNKEGFKTWLPFDLKHVENISVTSDGFRRNVMDFSALDNTEGKHAFRKRLTGSKQSFTLNTNWISEYYVQQIEELLLSEYVWMKGAGLSREIPVNVKTSKVVKKRHVNDKLIQYTFDVESASEYLNTVR